MARAKTVKLSLQDSTICYVPEEEFNLGGVPEKPDSVIGNYIHGSRGPMLRVNPNADMSGEYYFINPQMVIGMWVTYL